MSRNRFRSRRQDNFGVTVAAVSALVFASAWWATSDDAPSLEEVDAWAERQTAAEPLIDHHFSGCNEARAAGYQNIPVSDPSYRKSMDGDGDGFACEPYR